MIAADLRILKRPSFSKSDWQQSVASSGLSGTTAGETRVGGRDVKDVIAHLIAAEGRVQEHIALGSVTAKRMTLIFRGLASLQLADFPEPVVVVKRTVARVIQTCLQAMAAYELGSTTPLTGFLAQIQAESHDDTVAGTRSATRSAVAKGAVTKGPSRGGA